MKSVLTGSASTVLLGAESFDDSEADAISSSSSERASTSMKGESALVLSSSPSSTSHDLEMVLKMEFLRRGREQNEKCLKKAI